MIYPATTWENGGRMVVFDLLGWRGITVTDLKKSPWEEGTEHLVEEGEDLFDVEVWEQVLEEHAANDQKPNIRTYLDFNSWKPNKLRTCSKSPILLPRPLARGGFLS